MVDLENDLKLSNKKKMKEIVELEIDLENKYKEIEEQNIKALKRMNSYGIDDEFEKTNSISYMPLSIQKDPEALSSILKMVTSKLDSHNIRILFEQRDKKILKKKLQDLNKSNV